MFSSIPWTTTVLAVSLAIIAALCFAAGAFLQQQAVAQTRRATDGVEAAARVGMESFRWLSRQPRWVVGWALTAAGTLLHLTALLLAPVSVVQPIGILAVPAAVLLAAHRAHARPGQPVVAGVCLAVAGTGAFVVLAGSAAELAPVTSTGLLTASLIVAATVVGLGLVTRLRSSPARCLAYASMGAVSFGFGSALIRVISRLVSVNGHTLWSPTVILTALATAGALTVGAWAVQQAYACGPAAVVLSALTVGDPLVAILLSAGLLGEGLHVHLIVIVAMVGCAALAATGVRLLARHHPAPASAPEPARVLTPTP